MLSVSKHCRLKKDIDYECFIFEKKFLYHQASFYLFVFKASPNFFGISFPTLYIKIELL